MGVHADDGRQSRGARMHRARKPTGAPKASAWVAALRQRRERADHAVMKTRRTSRQRNVSLTWSESWTIEDEQCQRIGGGYKGSEVQIFTVSLSRANILPTAIRSLTASAKSQPQNFRYRVIEAEQVQPVAAQFGVSPYLPNLVGFDFPTCDKAAC